MTIQSGIPVARIEMLDELQVKASNAYSKLTLPEMPILFLEFHGSEHGVAEQSKAFAAIAEDLGGGPFEWATKAEDRSKLWQARHDGYWAAMALRPGCKAFATDVCVPISRLAECVTQTQADAKAAGAASQPSRRRHFHLSLILAGRDSMRLRAKRFVERLVESALAMEGLDGRTCVGQGNRVSLRRAGAAARCPVDGCDPLALDPADILIPEVSSASPG